jgi:hypothetical protein
MKTGHTKQIFGPDLVLHQARQTLRELSFIDKKYGARLNKYGARDNKYGARLNKYGPDLISTDQT